MLARLGSGLALAAVAALALVGCSPPEPVATTPAAEPTVEPTLSDEEALRQAQATFDSFYQAVDAQFAAGQASPEALQEDATPELADSFASEIAAFLAEGEVSRGVLEITAIELEERTADRISTLMCTDASGIETTDAQGNVKPAGGLVAWSMELVRDDGRLLIDTLDPVQDQGICGS